MNRKILILDDDAVFASALMRSLLRRGIESVHASSVEQALPLLGGVTDAVVDLNLGAVSGLHFIPELRKQRPSANILVLTGYASIASTVQAIKLGADNYLAKPADTSAILKALDQDAAESAMQDEHSEVMSVPRMEWEHIQRVLAENEGNVSATARALNMHRRTLQRKLFKKPVGK
ncbi:MAG: response regulator [Limnobacter sp.]|nr:response regulator [Limnobacter sp.]